MKIQMHGAIAGTGWNGQIHSWPYNAVVEVDDTNSKEVEWARYTVDSGAADLVEDVKAKVPAKSEPKSEQKAPAKAEQKPAAGK